MSSQTFIFEGTVPTKKNKYRIGKGGRGLYKPSSVTEFETHVARTLLVEKAKKIEGPMEVSHFLVVHSSKAEPDIDGSLTTVLDCLQDAGLFENDKAVVAIDGVRKRVSSGTKDPVRCEITIGNCND